MASIRKIAEAAGVSHMTAQRALRNARYIAVETRARVLAVATALERDEFPYRAAGGRPTIACLLPRLDTFSRLVFTLCQLANAHGTRLLLYETPRNEVELPALLCALVSHQVTSILISAEYDYVMPRTMAYEFFSHDILPVLIGMHSEMPMDTLMSDEQALVDTAYTYLSHLGHHQIAYLGPRWHPRSQFAASLQNHRRIAALHGAQPFTCRWYETPEAIPEDILRVLTRQDVPTTAIFAFNDYYAARLLQLARHDGLQVPEQLSILGCANLDFSSYLTPPLTTFDHQPEVMGAQALAFIRQRLDALADGNRPPPQHLLVPVKLVQRASCGPPPA